MNKLDSRRIRQYTEEFESVALVEPHVPARRF